MDFVWRALFPYKDINKTDSSNIDYERLQIHERLANKVEGCLKCGRRVYPGENIWRCGTCLEMCTTFCCACFDQRKEEIHEHKLYLEPVYWEKEWPEKEFQCCGELLEEGFKMWEERWFLGRKTKKSFTWETYGEIKKKVCKLASALRNKCGVKPGEKVLLIGKSSLDWYLVQYALLWLGAIPVAVHASISQESLENLIGKVEPSCICISKNWPPFETKICCVALDDDDRITCDNKTGENKTVDQLLCEISDEQGMVHYWNRACGDDTAMLLSTSGSSSSTPKLVIVTHHMMSQQARPGKTAILLSYQPLRQSFDIIAKGGRIGISSGNLDNIFEDCKILRPTVFGSTPALFESLFNQYQNEEIGEKQQNHEILQKWKEKNIFGNRCHLLITGGAKSSKELKKWLFDAIGCVVIDGFGTTETGGLTSSNEESNLENVYLIDSPEYGFLTSDDPPRGEIIAFSERLTPGYFKDEEANKRSFFKGNDGRRYFRTGDIGELIDGKIRIIGRASSLFKVKQGFFVSPSKLENVYKQIPFIESILVWGDEQHVVAFVVPVDSNTIIKEEQVLFAIRDLSKTHQLLPYEIPRKVVFDFESWTVENGLMLSTGKIARLALQSRFRSHICLKKERIAQSASENNMIQSGINLGLRCLLTAILNLDANQLHLRPSDTLFGLGFDSIMLSRLSNEIKVRYGKQIPSTHIAKYLHTIEDLQMAIFTSGNNIKKRKIIKNWESQVEFYWGKYEQPKPTITGRGCETIFLTGASGFLGQFLLKKLLSRFPTSKIICLKHKGSINLINNDRVEIVDGDLSCERFGWSIENWKLLQRRVTLCVHNGARVNSILPYDELKNINVLGTLTVLCLCRNVYHISTIGFLNQSGITAEELSPSSNLDDHCSGYAQSKWVAEQLAYRAGAMIFRVGSLFTSTCGIENEQDSIISLIRGVKDLGAVCLNPDSPLPLHFKFLPVDVAADNIVSKIGAGKFVAGKIHHIVGVQQTSLESLIPKEIKHLNATEFRKECSLLDYEHPLAKLGISTGATYTN